MMRTSLPPRVPHPPPNSSARKTPLALMFFLSLTCLSAAACQDLQGSTPESPYPDGICGPADNEPRPQGRLLVATEQYGSGGGVTAIDLETRQARVNVALTHDDVTLRWYDHKIWVLNRYGADNIMILDGDDYSLLKQFSVKLDRNTPCNPHDIAFLDRCRLYVSCYEQPDILVVDPQAPPGEELQGTVDLRALADDDGIPEASHMHVTSEGVWITVSRMRRNHGWVPAPPSYLALVDPRTDVLIDEVELQGRNPVGPIHEIPATGALVVATAGDWSGEHAGLELVDPATKTSSSALSAQELGGVVSSFSLDASGCGYAVVSRPITYETAVKRFCLEPSMDPISDCVPFDSFLITDVAVTDSGALVVTDTSSQPPGVRFFTAGECPAQKSDPAGPPLSTGFAPGFTNPLLLIPERRE